MDFGNISRRVIKDRIIKKNILPYECNICKTSEWNGEMLSLHLDHINGINNDNRLSNLRFLCPNCHSQTETYCGKNIEKKYSANHQKVSDEVLVENMRLSKNPSQALKRSGLVGAGNYRRIYILANIHGISHMKKEYVKKVAREPIFEKCGNPKCDNTFEKKTVTMKYCCNKCSKEASKKSKYSDEEILQILTENNFNYRKTGIQVGISDNAVRKRVKKLMLVNRVGI